MRPCPPKSPQAFRVVISSTLAVVFIMQYTTIIYTVYAHSGLFWLHTSSRLSEFERSHAQAVKRLHIHILQAEESESVFYKPRGGGTERREKGGAKNHHSVASAADACSSAAADSAYFSTYPSQR